jgi:hypothetical protein
MTWIRKVHGTTFLPLFVSSRCQRKNICIVQNGASFLFVQLQTRHSIVTKVSCKRTSLLSFVFSSVGARCQHSRRYYRCSLLRVLGVSLLPNCDSGGSIGTPVVTIPAVQALELVQQKMLKTCRSCQPKEFSNVNHNASIILMLEIGSDRVFTHVISRWWVAQQQR